MPHYLCATCGVEYGPAESPPARCRICEDPRQYVPPGGQAWTTMEALQADHHNVITELEPGLHQIVTEPAFGIGQRALLVQASGGNVLWDCVSLIDDATVKAVQVLGGLSAMAASHPHMFGAMVAWSHAFGGAPIHLPAGFERWVGCPDPLIQYWSGDQRELEQGVSLHRCGGHFTDSDVLLWPDGADGRGVLLTSDTLHVTRDRRHISFMYSYPNYIPLPAATVDRIVERVLPLPFDRVYSHFTDLQILADGKEAVRRSAERYKRAIEA